MALCVAAVVADTRPRDTARHTRDVVACIATRAHSLHCGMCAYTRPPCRVVPPKIYPAVLYIMIQRNYNYYYYLTTTTTTTTTNTIATVNENVFISESVTVNIVNVITCQPASILQEENLRGFCVCVCVHVYVCVPKCVCA